MTILSTLVLLGVLIFIHELGHFVAARSVGIRVERFSVGFGPRIAGFTRGDTEYVLSIIPLGGYVKMGGMEDEIMEAIEGGERAPGGDAAGLIVDSTSTGLGMRGAGPPEGTGSDLPSGGGARVPNDDDFDSKSVLARAWVISAGVIMNMVFAFVTYTVVAGLWGNPVQDTIRFGGVNEDWLPASVTGLTEIPAGADLVSVAGTEPRHWGDVRDALLQASTGPITVEYACGPGACADAPNDRGSVQVVLPQAEEERTLAVDAVSFWLDPIVEFVNPSTPAQRAGIRPGDRIVEVQDRPVGEWSEVRSLIQQSAGVEIGMLLERDGERIEVSLTPEAAELVDPVTGEASVVGQIGMITRLPEAAFMPVSPAEAVRAGWDDTVFISSEILAFLGDLVTGQMSARNVGSILAVGEMSGQAAAEGLPIYLRFMALFSVNLAILNLLPIPVLDGGHLVFLGIEAVRGQPLSVKQRLRWSQFGFALLIGIMALALGNDVLRIFGL